MKAIIINGYSRVGKSTFVGNIRMRLANVYEWSVADYARNFLLNNVKQFVDRDFSDKTLKANYPIEYRNALIHLTKLFTRTQLVWEELYSVVSQSRDDDILFIHAREPKDFPAIYDTLSEIYDVSIYTVYLNREDVPPANEQDVDGKMYLYDYQIDLPPLNTPEYQNVIDKFINDLKLKEN